MRGWCRITIFCDITLNTFTVFYLRTLICKQILLHVDQSVYAEQSITKQINSFPIIPTPTHTSAWDFSHLSGTNLCVCFHGEIRAADGRQWEGTTCDKDSGDRGGWTWPFNLPGYPRERLCLPHDSLWMTIQFTDVSFKNEISVYHEVYSYESPVRRLILLILLSSSSVFEQITLFFCPPFFQHIVWIFCFLIYSFFCLLLFPYSVFCFSAHK